MGTLQWTAPEAPVTALSTGLNSLGNGSMSAASAAIENGTDRYTFMTAELVLASGPNVTAGRYCLLWLFAQVDGSNYEETATNVQYPASSGTFSPSGGVGAKRLILANLVIPPARFVLVLENQCGANLASSGNTVTIARYSQEVVLP